MPERPNKWAVLAIVALGVFMATLDSSIVNISLPAIARYFAVPLGGMIEWVVIAYLVVIAATLLSAGRLADLIGHRAIWTAGLVVFTVGSALCGVAPSLALLVAARALQGLGGALLMAISPAMLTRAFPAKERGRALGLNAVFVALGVSAGPTLGGVITERLSWRWIFFVNVPLGVIAVAATLRVLSATGSRRRERFDVLGAVLLGVGLAALTGGLSFGAEAGWGSPVVIGVLVASAALLFAFSRVEAWRPHAVVDLALFRDRVFASSTIALVLSFLALFATSFLMPFYLEQLRGMSAERAGLYMTALPLTIGVLSPLSGALGDRIGSRGLGVTGLAVSAVGLVLASRLDAESSGAAIVVALAVAGAGQAIFQPANNSALMGAAPQNRQGVASGLLATSRVVGQSLSVAVAGAIFASFGASRAGAALASGARDPRLTETFERGFRAALVTCAGVAAAGALVSALRGREAGPAPAEPRRAAG